MPKSFGSKSLGFLAAKALPVDGYKLRNSLYLTQPLRSPAQAALNIISREDTLQMREEAKYAGMAQATRRLMGSFNQALCVPLFHGKPLAQHSARGARSSKNLRSDQSGSASYNCHSCAWLSPRRLRSFFCALASRSIGLRACSGGALFRPSCCVPIVVSMRLGARSSVVLCAVLVAIWPGLGLKTLKANGGQRCIATHCARRDL